MGCAASEANLPANSAYGSKCTAVDTLSSQNKKKIRKIIQKDELTELVITINQLNIPLNVELSESKTRWLMIHFCARWDSEKCLEYLLKSFFVGSAMGYIDYVNATSIDGETPLHVCSTWNSEKAFTVFHFYGGLNLNARDKRFKAPFDIANQSRSKNILQILRKYKQNNVNFTMVNPQRLTNPTLLSQTPLKQRIQKQLKKDKNMADNQISQSEKALQQQKKRLQAQIIKTRQQKIQKQIQAQKQKQKLKQNNMLATQKLRYQKELQDKLNQKLKLQKQKYEQMVKQHQKQLQKLKSQLKMAEDERISKEKLEAQRQAEKYADQQKQRMKQIAKQKQLQAQRLRKQKQRQAIQNPEKQDENNNKKQPKQQVNVQQAIKVLKQALQAEQVENAAQIQQLYRTAIEAGQFTDQQFPPTVESIGNPESENYYDIADRVEWLRPIDIFGQEAEIQLFENGVDPNDIMQGELGVCYMLATVASLAKTPDNISNIFIFTDTSIGFYVLKFFIHGKPKYFVIDDFIPCDIDTYAPLFTRPAGNQLWVMLIEKCWAKAIGSYLSAQGMQPQLMMQDLSGAPGYGRFFNNQDQSGSNLTFAQHIQKLILHNRQKHTIVICTGQDQIQGMVQNHAYTLLDIINYKGSYIFKIRNPWSNTEYQGMYSEGSPDLTPQLKQLLGFEDTDEDGVFFVSQGELQQLFQCYSVSTIYNQFGYSYIEFQSKSLESLYFKFTLPKDSITNVRVIQPFDRMLNDPDYQYGSVVIEVGKIESNGKVTFIGQGDPHSTRGQKSIHAFETICEKLKAGEYFAHVRMNWPQEQKYHSAVLSVYANDGVDIQMLQPDKGLQLVKQLYISHAFKSQKITSPDNLGTYRVSGMKGQFTFVCETEKPGNWQAVINFRDCMMMQTQLDIGKYSDVELRVPVAQGRPGIGTSVMPYPMLMGGIQGTIRVSFRGV